MEKIEIKIISRETIKPSSPTPDHLKKFNLSLHDQSIPQNIYVSLIFFYRNHHEFKNNNVSEILKLSLSETLTDFYPLAGRIVDNELFIDCTDDGAEFGEAEVSGGLSDILEHPDPELLSGLLPMMSVQEPNKLLLVQANFFQGCGGMAIGVSVSHTLADASTVSLLVKRWAAVARGARDTVVPDLSAIASLFPAVPMAVTEGVSLMIPGNFKFKTTSLPLPNEFASVMRDLLVPGLRSSTFESQFVHESLMGFYSRIAGFPHARFEAYPKLLTLPYVFDSVNIAALKAEARSESVQRPSSVEVVSGHIWMNMMRLNLGHTISSSYLSHAMNLRKRMEPALSENSFGNLVGIVRSRVDEGEQVDLKRLVGKMRKGFERVSDCLAREGSFLPPNDNIKELNELLVMGGSEMYIISSWCRLGFYENADFGWGRPVWILPRVIQMLVLLMDCRDGDGVEAWITFPEKMMEVLETNHQSFLEFVSLNPSVRLH